LGFDVALQTPFLIQYTMPIEQHFRLHASTATTPCPNHNVWLFILNHGFPFNREGFKIGVCPGFRPLGSLGRTGEEQVMLPDTVHKLPREERFAYARLLAFMARIDNELTVDEMAMFEQRLGTALLSPGQREQIRAALKNPPSLEECLEDLSGEAGRLALRDAVMMAAADGTVDEDERDALEDISEHLGLKEDAVEQLLTWTVKGYKWMKEGYELLDVLEE